MLFHRRMEHLLIGFAILAILPGSLWAGQVTEVHVTAAQPQRIVLEMDLGTLEMLPVDVDGRAGVLPSLKGMSALMDRGSPQLPVIRKALLIDDLADVEIRIIDAEVEIVQAGMIVPSKGQLTRDQDPSLVPFSFGPAYRSNQLYPAEEAVLHEPFIMRDFRGIVVELRPVRCNPVTGELAVTRRMTIELVQVPGVGTNPLVRAEPLRGVDREFEQIYSNTFANWDEVGQRYTVIPEPGRCLILTADQFYDQVFPLYEWELQKGIPTILTQLSEVGTTANDVKAYIQSLYDEPESITYIILVGDSAQMPYLRGTAENAPSDPMYVKLAGSDHYPDALISRLSAQNATHVETQVARSIHYEMSPDMGAAGDWYHKATGIASSDYGGGAYDWQRADWLRATLLGYTYTEVDQIYAPSATKQMIRDAINAGRSLVNYIGHGSTTAWSTTGFNVNDVHGLYNGFKLPYICSVACVNGDFTYGECFAEAWLRSGTAEAPIGAIGIHAASTNAAWVPPCDMQTETVRLLVEEECNSLGGLAFNGVAKAMDLWPGYDGTMLMEQYHLFGDCTIMIRSDTPAELTVEHADALAPGEPTFEVTTPGVAGARAALYADGVLYGVAYTDGSGAAAIPIDPLPPVGTELSLTVTAYNHETIIHVIPVVTGIDAAVAIEEWNFVGQSVVAGEPTTLEILLHNSGTETAPGVSAVLRPIGTAATVEDSTAQYGDIEGGASVWGVDDYSFTPDVNLPDGAMIDLALEINTNMYLSWDDTLSAPVSAPSFAYHNSIVDDTGGDVDCRIDGGEHALLTVGLINEGSAGATEINAHLVTFDHRVTITQADAVLADLAAGEEAYFETAFELDVNPAFVEGSIMFVLQLETGRGRNQMINFSVPVGGFLETVELIAPRSTHEAPEGFVDEWHVTETANATPGGERSWKCGAVSDSAFYAPLNDSRLITPPVSISDRAVLRFWHRMEAETDTSQTGVAFDGGCLEISVNGGSFELLTPVGGYDYVTEDRGNGSPFPAGTPCFSGSFDWTQVEVDLSAYAGTIRVRFRFGSDGEVGATGWFVDDIDIRGLDQTVDAPEFVTSETSLRLSPAQPNPFNPRTMISLAIPAAGPTRLVVVDPAGRIVRTLIDEVRDSGPHSVVWNGKDQEGHSLPSGVYYSRLEYAGQTRTGRLVMLK